VAELLTRIANERRADPRPLQFEARPTQASPAILHQAALIRARAQLAESHSEKDRILAQEVRAVDDLVRAANLLIERLREWYALHAPEAVRLSPDAERLTAMVAEHGDRDHVLAALEHAEMSAASLGTDLDAGDLEGVQTFAKALRGVHESWRGLERRIGALMEEVAPNLAAAVGPVLGARLIAQAGSLERLATYPAGTVQLLGAEKALFRHLKEGTLPPKHGVLFQHPAIHAAAPWQRGAAARALAQAAALAAKADAFTGRDMREEIKADVEAALARIKRERQAPPQNRRGPPRGPPGRGPPGRGPPGSGPSGRGPPRSGTFGARPPGRGPPDRGPPDRGPPGRGPPGRGPPGRGPPGGSGPPRGPGGAGGQRREDRRDDRRDDRDKRDGPKRRGPGAFRRRDGPAPPPGRGDK
jgi:nucleolar protein 56